MPDPRFFDSLGPLALGALAVACDAKIVRGDPDMAVRGVAPLRGAAGDQIASFRDSAYARDLAETSAGAVILREADLDAAPFNVACLVSDSPQAAYAMAARALHRPRRFEAGQPSIHPQAELEADVELAPGVVIGAGARIGRETRIGPGVYIGPGVCIGRHGEIGPNAAIGFALIGDRVRVLSGAVIGEPGFGVGVGPEGAVDIPQLGRVILQDGVTLGANSCIDRGAYGDTVVGENTKIDNLVHIGHNVQVGRNCMLAAYTGISGSSVIGDGAQLGGRAGILDHVKIGAGARIGAASAVTSDVPAGETWTGYPARPLRRFLREAAWVARAARRPKGRAEGEGV